MQILFSLHKPSNAEIIDWNYYFSITKRNLYLGLA